MNQKDSVNFGEFLQSKRAKMKITMRQMAEKLGVSAPFLSDVEKGRRNSLIDMDNLEKLRNILCLNDEEYEIMLNLAGKQRNTVAPDLPEYIIGRDYVSAALRTARDLGAGEKEWQEFVEKLKSQKG
ncbi:MAG: helix-turn-helix transcriptional regulator [Oscillospiraceae bacterium]|nr:helix-turn-helix transcriptional regulator [Oscillospiraceae bacterium]